ncbi:MAG: hypothetical protein J6C46_06785 [Clostridia bacterium]|nr:hypothetical protein [Clostridia bacterium]
MAKITGSVEKNGYEFYAILTETKSDDYLTTNITTVNYSVYLKNGATRTESSNWTFNAKIDGNNVYNKTGQKVASNSVDFNEAYLLFSGSKEISHNADGSKKITFSAFISRSSYSSFDPGYCKLEGTFDLTKINRASIWDFTNTQMSNIEDALTLKINKYVTDYTDKVIISSADEKTVVKTINNASNNQQIKFTREELTKLYTLDSNETLTNLKFLMTLSTYDGNGNLVGDAQKITMSAYLLNANPIFTYTIEETEAKVIDLLDKNDASTIIKSVSKPKIEVTASALKGATIKTISIVNGTQANANENPYIFNNVQTGTFTIVVTDSRNLTKTQVVTKNLINYTPVYINSYSFERESQTSSKILLNADVTCYSSSFNSITNIPTVMYKMGTNGTYKEVTSGFTFENNKITFNNYSLGEILPYTQTNKFYLYVLDLLTEDTENEIVSKGVATIEAGEHDFQVNGTLYLANDNRENKRAINISADGNKLYRMNANGNYENFVPSIFKGVISDLNNATVDGSYTWYKEATNRPWSNTSAWGCVMVQNNNGWIFQTAYATYDVDNSRIAHRGYINGAWTEWHYAEKKNLLNMITGGTHFKAGYKIDNKDVYVKRINLGNLPNKTAKTVSTGLSTTNIDIQKAEGLAGGSTSAGYFYITLPDVNPNNLAYATRITFTSTNNIYNIVVDCTGIDRSNYTGHVDVYFTYK